MCLWGATGSCSAAESVSSTSIHSARMYRRYSAGVKSRRVDSMSAASHLSHGLGWEDARRSSLDCASAQILASH